MLRQLEDFKPDLVVHLGDLMEASPASRWANEDDWSAEDEYIASAGLLDAITGHSPQAEHVWCMGNHDTRFSSRLAQTAPQYVRVHGTDLPDHFDAWNFSWSCQINEDVIIKHRWHNGVHAAWSNALKSGFNIFTNHLHRLCVTPITDYGGRRYGVDCGTLSDFGPTSQKFTYGEDNPFNWGSGYAVATWRNGKLLPPELVIVQDGVAWFRGKPV
jgi:hypothetical protein